MDWYPWGEEVFKEARSTSFLSVKVDREECPDVDAVLYGGLHGDERLRRPVCPDHPTEAVL